MLRRSLAFAFCILIVSAIAYAGDVLKTDDTLVAGDIISFDGSNLQLQGFGDTAATFRVTIPIQEIVRVRFQAPSSPTGSDPSGRNPQGFVPYSAPSPLPPPPGSTPYRTDVAPAGTGVVLPSVWQLKLAGNDVVSGALRGWSENQFTIDIQQGRAILQIPMPAIREIWRASPDLVKKAKALKMQSTSDDVAYVLKDSEVVAVKGTVLGVQNLSLGFLFDGQERKINIDKLLGVELVSQKRSATTNTAATKPSSLTSFRLLNGDVLSGQWTQLKDGFVTLGTSWAQPIQLPVTAIASVDVRNTNVVWLSELKPVKVEQTPYFDRIIPWKADTSLDGGPLRLNDNQQYARGVAMHSRCVLEYELGGEFQRFQARLGFEPMPPGAPTGRAAVRLLADGKTLFNNQDLRGDEPPKDLAFEIQWAKHLTLEVDFGKDQDTGDRVVWANARLVRADQ